MSRCKSIARRRGRRPGQALVELAVVALAVYLLLAAILTFGFMMYAGQGLQTAVDLAAREISRLPLPADDYSLEQVLRGNAQADPQLAAVRQQVYDEHYLVLNLDTLHGRASLAELVADLPLVNQQLVPLMLVDQIEGVRVLRYPGAVWQDTDASDDPLDPPPSGWRVSIPLVVARDAQGVESIRWVAPLEPIVRGTESRIDPFRISSPERGVVGLRLNYPVQSPVMSSFRPSPAGPFEPTIGRVHVADDSAVGTVGGSELGPAGPLVSPDSVYGPTAGRYGLGRQAALGSQTLTGGLPVRPYRRVLTAQALYRRELFP